MIFLPPLGAPKRHMITHHCIEIANNKSSTACRCRRRRGVAVGVAVAVAVAVRCVAVAVGVGDGMSQSTKEAPSCLPGMVLSKRVVT